MRSGQLGMALFGILLLVATSAMAGTVQYQYDELNRLTEARYPDGSVISYVYDAVGNRVSMAVTDGDNDNDGLPNQLEETTCTDPDDADTDDDGIPDGVEDSNLNGQWDREEEETNPCERDSDGDGLQDGTESGYTLADIGPDTNTQVFFEDADPDTTTDPLDPDTDGDGLTDGQEDANKNGMWEDGERNPGDRDMEFDEASNQITNSYTPFGSHEKKIYAGTGSFSGYGRYIKTLGAEVVDGVACRVIRIKGYGHAADPEDDFEWYEFWLAQDTDGVVWLFQIFDAEGSEITTLGQTNAVVWMPALPVAGQVFRELGDDFCEVTDTDVTVPVLSTGKGPYENCLRVVSTRNDADEDVLFFAPGEGSVKEDWNDESELNGWEFQEITTGKEGDLDYDGDVDGMDLSVFEEDLGRDDCSQQDPCEGDLDHDGKVDEEDLDLFAEDYGWIGEP